MKHYALIGEKLGHSWSKEYFTRKFEQEGIEAAYHLIEVSSNIAPKRLAEMLQGKEIDGFNVTIPYKEIIIPYLKELDPIAAEIGAVNVIKEGIGYNTDWIGFVKSLTATLSNHAIPTQALILGCGGAAKAVQYGLKTMGIMSQMINARFPIHTDLQQYGLIVNATPLGMSPNIQTYPDLHYDTIGKKHILFDCVYNPAETEFLKRGKMHGALTTGGKKMLEIQAEESWKIWTTSAPSL